MEAYYKEYVKDFPMVIRAAWGFTVETATLAIRLVLSGVFDAYPRLKIVLGHLGETLPFLLWRIDQALARPGGKALSFRDVFCSHFYITTSGNFSNPALLCCVMEMGIDRILFAVDWPFVANKPGSANGWKRFRCATRTRSRSSAAMPSGCSGCEFADWPCAATTRLYNRLRSALARGRLCPDLRRARSSMVRADRS